MSWIVEGYGEEINGVWQDTVDLECEQLLHDTHIGLDCAKLIGWLKAVAGDKAHPDHEPETTMQGQRLRCRSANRAVMIFVLLEGGRLLVLRCGRAASTFPTVADLNVAAERLSRWRP
jgi:hypothetical protein